MIIKVVKFLNPWLILIYAIFSSVFQRYQLRFLRYKRAMQCLLEIVEVQQLIKVCLKKNETNFVCAFFSCDDERWKNQLRFKFIRRLWASINRIINIIHFLNYFSIVSNFFAIIDHLNWTKFVGFVCRTETGASTKIKCLAKWFDNYRKRR
jgi:hypothetical protein